MCVRVNSRDPVALSRVDRLSKPCQELSLWPTPKATRGNKFPLPLPLIFMTELERPIDTPSLAVYRVRVESSLGLRVETPSCHRVLSIIEDWGTNAHLNIRQDAEEIAFTLRTMPKLLRDLNAALPQGYTVQCPTKVDVLNYFVLITSAGGQVLSASGPDGPAVPHPSSTQELRNVLPMRDEWEAIQAQCAKNQQWGSCISQLLQTEYMNPKVEDDYKRVVLRRLVHLTRNTGMLPPSIFIHNITREFNGYHHESGGFADITQGTVNGTNVCLKSLRVYSGIEDDLVKKSKAFYREVILWSRLRHQNVLPFLGANDDFRFTLISPWMSNGNLRAFLKAHPDHDRSTASYEVSSGLAYLHGLSPPIYHRDVKAVNVLVTDDLRCCLGDFGLSAIAGSQRLESKSGYAGLGTRRWQAPELVESEIQETPVKLDFAAADVYAFGCTVLEIYTGENPFKDLKKEMAVVEAVRKGTKPVSDEGFQSLEISELFKDLVQLCWHFKPSRRPTMSHINTILKAEVTSRRPAPEFHTIDEESAEPHLKFEETRTVPSTRSSIRQTPGIFSNTSLPRTPSSPSSIHYPDIQVAKTTTVSLGSTSGGTSSAAGAGELHRRSSSSINAHPELKIEVPKPPTSSSTLAGGLMTPSADPGYISPVVRGSPFTELKEQLTVEHNTQGIELELVRDGGEPGEAGQVAPTLATLHVMMTPPETPIDAPGYTRSFSSPKGRLSASSPVFQPRAGVKAKAHRLNLEAPAFRPSFAIPQARHVSFTTGHTMDRLTEVVSSHIPLTEQSSTAFVEASTCDTPNYNFPRLESSPKSTLNANAVQYIPRISPGSPTPPPLKLTLNANAIQFIPRNNA